MIKNRVDKSENNINTWKRSNKLSRLKLYIALSLCSLFSMSCDPGFKGERKIKWEHNYEIVRDMWKWRYFIEDLTDWSVYQYFIVNESWTLLTPDIYDEIRKSWDFLEVRLGNKWWLLDRNTLKYVSGKEMWKYTPTIN